MQIEGSKKKIYWRETQHNCITESPAAIYPHSSSDLEVFSAIQKNTKFLSMQIQINPYVEILWIRNGFGLN